MLDTADIASKMDKLEPGLIDLPESLALAEKAILSILADDSTADTAKLKAAEMVFQKHQVGSPDEAKAIATKEDFEHLRGVISEVKEVLEGHVEFYERRYAGESTPGLKRVS